MRYTVYNDLLRYIVYVHLMRYTVYIHLLRYTVEHFNILLFHMSKVFIPFLIAQFRVEYQQIIIMIVFMTCDSSSTTLIVASPLRCGSWIIKYEKVERASGTLLPFDQMRVLNISVSL